MPKADTTSPTIKRAWPLMPKNWCWVRLGSIRLSSLASAVVGSIEIAATAAAIAAPFIKSIRLNIKIPRIDPCQTLRVRLACLGTAEAHLGADAVFGGK